jgi:MFS family permease
MIRIIIASNCNKTLPMSTPDLPLSEQSSLWRDRAFVLFWFARVVSEAGTVITTVVLPILIFQLTGSALRTSLLATVQVIPYFVFGLFAGALADRFNRRRMMVACDLINVVLLGSVPIAAAFHLLTLTHIYVVAVLSATAFVWFDAANFGALPTLVGSKRIFEANSIIWAAATAVGIIGPAVGGVLATTIGAAQAISLDSLSYLLSAVAISLVPRALSHTRTEVAVAESVVGRTLSDIREGLAFVWRHPLVRPLTLLGFGVSFTGGAMIGLLVVSAVQSLGLSENDGRIGLLYTAGAAGRCLPVCSCHG